MPGVLVLATTVGRVVVFFVVDDVVSVEMVGLDAMPQMVAPLVSLVFTGTRGGVHVRSWHSVVCPPGL